MFDEVANPSEKRDFISPPPRPSQTTNERTVPVQVVSKLAKSWVCLVPEVVNPCAVAGHQAGIARLRKIHVTGDKRPRGGKIVEEEVRESNESADTEEKRKHRYCSVQHRGCCSSFITEQVASALVSRLDGSGGTHIEQKAVLKWRGDL